MRVYARGTWDPMKLASLNLPRGDGLLCINVGEVYREPMAKQLKALAKRQAQKHQEAMTRWESIPPVERGVKPEYADTLLELEIELTIHFRRRTVDQNKLYWKIREIQSNWVNGNPSSRRGYFSKLLPDAVVTPEDLHNSDVETYCEKRAWRIMRADRFAFARGMEYAEIGRVTSTKDVPGEPEKIDVVVTKTTSFFTTKEMGEWTQRVINEIIDSGLLQNDIPEFMGLMEDFKEIIKGDKNGRKETKRA